MGLQQAELNGHAGSVVIDHGVTPGTILVGLVDGQLEIRASSIDPVQAVFLSLCNGERCPAAINLNKRAT